MVLKAGSQNAPSFDMTWLVVKQGGQYQRVHHFNSNTAVTPGQQHGSQGFDISPRWPTGISVQQFASDSLQEVSATAPRTSTPESHGEQLPVGKGVAACSLAITLHMPWRACMDYPVITVITVIIISFALEAAAVMLRFCLWRLQLQQPLPAMMIHPHYMAYSETIHTVIGCHDYNTT